MKTSQEILCFEDSFIVYRLIKQVYHPCGILLLVFWMAGSLNKVILIGHIGNAPEIRSTQDGREIANFSLATNETWKDKNTNEQRSKTHWHRVVIYIPALVEIVKKHVNKGSKLYVEGSLQTREWNDQNGVRKFTTEVVLQGFNSKVILLDSVEKSFAQDVNNIDNTEKKDSIALDEDIEDEIPPF